MTTMFKPMLAGKAPKDLSKLVYPVIASPKLDGIRCLRPYGMSPVTRSFKPIPNKHIAGMLEEHLPEGFDGEIIIPGAEFSGVASGVMRRDGEPEFEFHVFDFILKKQEGERFVDRVERIRKMSERFPSWIKMVVQMYIPNVKILEEYEKQCLAEGYEGVMVRQPDSPYKCGRSTTNEGYLLNIKRFADDEAVVVGFEELMHNANEAKKDAFGRTERSSHKANKVGKGMLGKLILEFNGYTFGVGTGFTERERQDYWAIRDNLLGASVTFKHQPSGSKDKPRFPVFKCFRKDV